MASLTRRLPGIGVLLMIGIFAASDRPASMQGRSDAAPQANPDAQFVPNELLVQFRGGTDEAGRAAAHATVGGRFVETVTEGGSRNDGKGDLELIALPPGMTMAAAQARLRVHPSVEFAEPNWVYYHQATSNDPYFTNGSLWGMYGDGSSPVNAFGSQAAEAWAAGNTGSDNVYIGIIDEGFMFNHVDLAANAWTNPYDSADGIDNDGNGYVDDVRGWDFDGNNNTTFDGTQDDHGTHVAGTIGAAGGNGAGVAGVNWNVTMISGKFLGRRGGTTANAVKAVNYFTDLKRRHGLNIVATNNSWGGGGFSQALLDAINAGGDENILFIAAAGNGGSDGVGDNNDTTASYPSNYQCTNGGTRGWDCVVAVAAITSTGAKSGFSNYGATTVDIGAPGSGIYSTLPGRKGASTYGSYSGTSMATPHVTGAAALYAATHPTAYAWNIKDAILGAAVPTPSLAGKTVTGGRLNVSGF
jgi:subtilisin family serine protease